MKDVRDIGKNEVILQLVDNQSVIKNFKISDKYINKNLEISGILRIFIV
jgi:hypothetical protein